MDIAVVNLSKHRLDLVRIKKLIKIVLSRHQGIALISIAFVSQREIRRLNKAYRNIDAWTDVLSFCVDEDDGLAEIALCPAVVKKQAAALGMSFQQLLQADLVHGLAHLAGFDHQTIKQARSMERWERLAHRQLEDFIADAG